ncbi:MAG: tetratricopeptide repeat protein [Bacteriovoracales bacterium]|nr:tetratricopeptide repeat protein [Bacteriovoracales bacterium]
MKKIILITLSVLFSSCASNRVRDGKDVDDITNSDFKKETLVRYNKNEDYYDVFDFPKSLKDSLLAETLQRSSSMLLRSPAEEKNGREVESEILKLASLCYKGEFEEAFSIVDNLYRRYKKHPGYWNQVGNCYFLLNDLRKADLFYKQALKYDKKYAPAYNNIGNIHIKRGEYEKSMAAFEKAYKLEPYSLTPIYNLAQIYLNFGVINKAENLFLKIERKRSGDPSVLGGLATIYLFKNKITESISFFKKIPSDNLENPSIGLNYAVALKVLGNHDDAQDIFDDVSNNRPEWREYYEKVKRFVREI